MNDVRFPDMRNEVVTALEALADPDYQRRVWLEHEYPSPSYYDDLSLNTHILFDDTRVLPDPTVRLGVILYAREVEPLRALGQVLDSMIDDLGDSDDSVYLQDARWPAVVEAARVALDVVKGSE